MFVSFTIGLLCGLSLGAVPWVLQRHGSLFLGEDEKYLLAAARAANGRLILRHDASGPSLLLLKEYPNPRRMEDQGQIQRLIDRKLLAEDPSGTPDRYVLTSAGRKASERLPEFPLQPVRQGSWFNSLSTPVRRMRK